MYLLQCTNGARVRLSKSALQILVWRWSGLTQADIAARLRSVDSTATEQEILKQVADTENRVMELAGKSNSGDPDFGFKATLFSSARAANISRAFVWLLAPLSGSIGSLLIVAASAALVTHPLNRSTLTPSVAAAAYALLLISLFFHEFGHSAACLRFGGTCGKIGFTIYLVFPAFFSDVSCAWAFSRRQRVIVDLAGSYLQCLIGSAYVAVGLLAHLYAFQYAALLVAVTTVFNLNPVFKFDGYWMLGDALGVTNLSRQPGRIAKSFYQSATKNASDEIPFGRGTIFFLIIYSVVTFLAWAAFLFQLGRGVLEQPPEIYSAVSKAMLHGGLTSASAKILGGSLLGFLCTLYFAVRYARNVRDIAYRVMSRYIAKS